MVDLPPPDSPTSAIFSPSRAEKVRPSRTGSPGLYAKETSSKATTGSRTSSGACVTCVSSGTPVDWGAATSSRLAVGSFGSSITVK